MLPLNTDLHQPISAVQTEVVVTPENLELASRETERLGKLLVRIQEEITKLQEREEVVATQLEAWSIIAAAGGKPGSECGQPLPDSPTIAAPASADNPGETDASNRRSIVVQETADAVVELLTELQTPLHYRDIYRELKARGMEIISDDPAKTLLARYFNDDRLHRISRGTYTVKEKVGGADVN